MLVEAIGEPGKRRFRVLVAVSDETFIVWMEKQQLQALGMALEQILEHVDMPISAPDVLPQPTGINRQSEHQFRLGRIELGVTENSERISIAAFDIQSSAPAAESGLESIIGQAEEQPGPPTLHFTLNRVQALYLSNEAETIAAAGRPRCPMCGSPMDPGGHVCPEQNGHLPLSIDTDEFE